MELRARGVDLFDLPAPALGGADIRVGARPYRAIDKCRVCGGESLVPVLQLGVQALTGVFPRSASVAVTEGPLDLVWCPDSGLLQLRHTYNPHELYGESYGYRSGLNASMVRHLRRTVRRLEEITDLKTGEVVLDIGSNDGTLLNAYQTPGLERLGIDPLGEKFGRFYSSDVNVVPDFFSAAVFRRASSRKARIVTSMAMLYDLDAPVSFVREVASVLEDDGVWHFEQSYMPSMLRTNSYDTICHEHIEYYSLRTLKGILDRAGLKILDVQMNGINGGSFAVTASKREARWKSNDAMVHWLVEQETRMGLDTPRPFRDFEERVFRHREDLRRLIHALVGDGKKILGYGASTKGNVLLQFCGLTPDEIPAIADVNPDKFGRVTPGTHIPIISEDEARAMKPDFFLVLPWHFRSEIMAREQRFIEAGGRIIFPFPDIEIV
jgi:hypothetical protein